VEHGNREAYFDEDSRNSNRIFGIATSTGIRASREEGDVRFMIWRIYILEEDF
jgi:hypothetical protein